MNDDKKRVYKQKHECEEREKMCYSNIVKPSNRVEKSMTLTSNVVDLAVPPLDPFFFSVKYSSSQCGHIPQQMKIWCRLDPFETRIKFPALSLAEYILGHRVVPTRDHEAAKDTRTTDKIYQRTVQLSG